MKMFNFGKTVYIVLALFSLIFCQAYAKDVTVDNLLVKESMDVYGDSIFYKDILLDTGIGTSEIVLDSQIFTFWSNLCDRYTIIESSTPDPISIKLSEAIYHVDPIIAEIVFTKDGLAFGNIDHPEVLIDKEDGNLVLSKGLVVSKDVKLVGTSGEIEAESDLNIKAGGRFCIGNCD